jgi:ABC-2 type transport system permease protein
MWSVYLFFYSKNITKIINTPFNGKEIGFLVNNFKDRTHPKLIEFFYSSFGFCPIISILVMFLVGSLVIDEYSSGTIKNMVAYGHKRIKIYISKLIIISLSIFILIVFLLFGTVIVGIFVNGWNDSFSFNVFMKMIKFTMLTVVILSSLASIYMCLAVFIRNKSILVALGIIAMFSISSCLPYLNNYADFIKYTPTFMLIEMGMLQINIYNMVSTCSVWIIITTLLGVFVFKNLEIK